MAIGTPVAETFVRVRPQADNFGRELRQQVTPQVQRVERSLQQSSREFGRFGRGALVGTGALGGLGRAAAFASTSFIGGAGLVYALKSTLAAASEAQVSSAQLTHALETAGISADEHAAAIEKNVQALSNLSGIDDEIVRGSFVKFIRATGDVNEAMRDTALAADIARGANIGLEAATKTVLRAQAGQARGLAILGVEVKKGATGVELLDQLQRKFGGYAEKYGLQAAGAQERFAVALENTQETIGTELLPQLTVLLTRASDWLADSRNQERIQRDVAKAVRVTETAVHGLADAVDDLHDALKPAVDLVGGMGEALKLLGIGFVSLKIARVLTGLGGIGAAAGEAGAAGEVGLLTTRLRGLSSVAIPAILIPVTYEITTKILNATGGDNFFKRQGARFGLAIDQILGRENPAGPVEIPIGGRGFRQAEILLRPDDRSVGPRVGSRGGFGTTGAGASGTTGPGGVPGTGIPWLDNLLARAEATTTRVDDERVLRRIQTVLRARLAKAKSLSARTDLQQKLNQFGEQLAGLEADDQQAIQDRLDREKDARDKRLADTRERRDRERALRDRRRRIEKARLERVEQNRLDRLDRLSNVPDAISLEEQIAEQDAKKEEDLLPILRKKRNAIEVRLRLLREEHGTTLQVLQQKLNLATVNRRIRDINQADKAADKGFSLTDLYAEAGNELALYGSNVGPAGAPLSRQDAHGALAGAVYKQGNQYAIVQHFHGERNAAQAIVEAARAAQAVR